MDFLPPGTNVNDRLEYWQEIFRKRKDLYRRQRDLSIFAFIGVYLLSVIDAYVKVCALKLFLFIPFFSKNPESP